MSNLSANIQAKLDQFQTIEANLQKNLLTQRAQGALAAQNSDLQMRIAELERELLTTRQNFNDAKANCQRLQGVAQSIDADATEETRNLSFQLQQSIDARRELEAKNTALTAELEQSNLLWGPTRQELENKVSNQTSLYENVSSRFDAYRRDTEAQLREYEATQLQKDREASVVSEKLNLSEIERARLESIRADLEECLNQKTRDYHQELEGLRARDRAMDSERNAMNQRLIDLENRNSAIANEKLSSEQAWDAERSRLMQDIRDLDAKVVKLQQDDETDKLKAKIVALESKLSQAFVREKSLWQQLQDQLGPLEKSVAEKEKQLAAVTEERDQVAAELKDGKIENEKLDIEYTRYKNDATNKIQKLEAAVLTGETEREFLRVENEKLNNRRLAELSEIRASVADQVTALTDQIRFAERENVSLKNSLDSAASENRKLVAQLEQKADELKSEQDRRIAELQSIRNEVDQFKERVIELRAALERSETSLETVKSEFSQYVAKAEKEIAQGVEIQDELVKRFNDSKLEYDRVLGEWKKKFQKATEIARASDENARLAADKIAENEDLFRQESIRYQGVIAEKDQALLQLNRDLESETKRRIDMRAELDRKKADFESRFLQVSQIEQQHADVITGKERLIEDLRLTLATNENLRSKAENASATEIGNLRNEVSSLSRENEALANRAREAESKVINLQSDLQRNVETVARLTPAVEDLERLNVEVITTAREQERKFNAEKGTLITQNKSLATANENMNWSLGELRTKYDTALAATVELENRCNNWQSNFEPVKIRHDQMIIELEGCRNRITELEKVSGNLNAQLQEADSRYMASINQERVRFGELAARERMLQEKLTTLNSDYEAHRAAATQKVNQLTVDLNGERNRFEQVLEANELLKRNASDLEQVIQQKTNECTKLISNFHQLEAQCASEIASKNAEMFALEQKVDMHFQRLNQIGMLK